MALLTLFNGGAAFAPSSLSGLTYQWAFSEGSGLGVANRAVASPTASFPNMIGSPEQFFATVNVGGGWEDIFGGATVTNAAAANPNNSETTASRLVLTATGNKAIRYIPGGNLLASGVTYTLSMYVKSNSGSTETVRLLYGNTPTFSTDKTVTVAAGWVRVTFTFTTAATGLYVGLANGSGGGAVDVLIWGATLHAGSSDLGYTNAQGDLLFPGGSSNPTWSSGRGLTFSGASQYLFCPLGASVALNGVSVYAVVRRHATVTDNQRWYGALLSTFGANFGSGQTLAVGAGGLVSGSEFRGGPTFSYGGTNPASTMALSAGEGVLTGTDHCIACTHDGTTLRIFIDGQLLAEGTSVTAAQAVTRLLVGYVQGAGGAMAGGCFKGDLLYMAVYNQGHTTSVARTATTGFLSLCASRTSYSSPPKSTVVVYDGDSLTAGLATYSPNRYGWTRLVTDTSLITLGIQARNYATVGNHVSDLQSRAATVRSDMTPAGVTKKIVVLQSPANDSTDTAVATSIQNYKDLCSSYKSAGWTVVALPMFPKSSADGPTATALATWRTTWNAFINNGANVGVYWDYVPPVDADATIGPTATADNATYFNPADRTHQLDPFNVIAGPIIQAKVDLAVA
jgi:hypothetical protein